MTRVLICVLLMALVTYLPRVSSGHYFQKENKIQIHSVFSGLYALCSFGSIDISGCILCDRAWYLGGCRRGCRHFAWMF